MAYKAVFIDWDDTLGDWAHSARQAQEVLYREQGLHEWWDSFEEWFSEYKTHNQELWDAYGRGETNRERLHVDQFLDPICRKLGMDKAFAPQALRKRCKDLGDEYIRLTNVYFQLVPDAMETLEYLASRYPLTVVSNGYADVQYWKIEHAGIKHLFRHIVLSEEVGVGKPDPRIFEEAMAQNRQEVPDLKKEEVVMIGDAYQSDILGAKNAGIDSIWILKNDADETQKQDARWIVPNLHDVTTIL